MASFQEMGEDFLAQQKFAVVGVASTKQATGNALFKALKDQGKTVYPVNPKAETVEGVTCYPSVTALPEKVDGVLIVTNPEVSEQVMRDCVEAGVPRVWMHNNPLFGKGLSSASEAATRYGRDNGVTVIDVGCPLMFVDFGHKCMRWFLNVTNRLPK